MEVYKKGDYPYADLTEKTACTNSINTICIYRNKQKKLYMDKNELKIYLIEKGTEKELTFLETIRFIDTIPEKSSQWKRDKILFIALRLGFFGV